MRRGRPPPANKAPAPAGAPRPGNEAPGPGGGPAAGSAAAGQAPLPGRATPDRATSGGSAPGQTETTIPLAEERLRVGKRDVGHGSVRVLSYVVETPVQDQ